MRKKEYERPTVQVVELKQQLALLAGSGGLDPLSPFAPDNNPDPLAP